MLREQENLCQWEKQENQYVFNSFIKKQGFEEYRMVWGFLLKKNNNKNNNIYDQNVTFPRKSLKKSHWKSHLLPSEENLFWNDSPFIWPRYAYGFGRSDFLQIFYNYFFCLQLRWKEASEAWRNMILWFCDSCLCDQHVSGLCHDLSGAFFQLQSCNSSIFHSIRKLSENQPLSKACI